MPLDREALVHLYRQMVTIRRFEERASEEFQQRAIPGIVHSYIGQEAVAVGVCASLGCEDHSLYMTPSSLSSSISFQL